MEEEKVKKIIEYLFTDYLNDKEECIEYIDEDAVNVVYQFLTTGERKKHRFVDCIGGYDAIRRLSLLL